ncbi:MAG TPA: hypothetical protein VK826_12725 [Bacteroidia bacterium]|nr:hypothetical protein [Bacteroidia bacterium]
MKKLLLVLGIACSIGAFGQASPVVVDSVKILPANPAATDSVFLHIYWHCNYGAGLTSPPTVISAGTNHAVNACYYSSVMAVISGADDSVFLFQGPPGVHMVSWQIFQNSGFSTSCDLLITANQQQVNVTLSSVDEHAASGTILWNVSTKQVQCAREGTLSIYQYNGQLLLEQKVTPGMMVGLPEGATGVLLATFRNESGESETLKIFWE